MRRFKGFTGWLHNAETRGPEEIVEIDGAEFQRQFKELCEESERLAAKARVANQHARAGGEPELRIWPMKAPASL